MRRPRDLHLYAAIAFAVLAAALITHAFLAALNEADLAFGRGFQACNVQFEDL